MTATKHRTAWLYQMNADNYPQTKYRKEVCVGEEPEWPWPTGYIMKLGGDEIRKGDLIFFFYTPTNTDCPGIYGFAKITTVVWESPPSKSEISFKALPPSDSLKCKPKDSNQIRKLIKRVRGGCAMGTMFPIEEKECAVLRGLLKRS